jgi:hypothetical protein
MTEPQTPRTKTTVTAGRLAYHDGFILPRDMLMTQTAGDAGSEKRKHRERREVHRGCDAGKDQIRKWSFQSH